MAGLAVGILGGAPAFAEDVVASIKRQLRSLGFRSILEERTLLGRIRITATRKDGVREIIVNPKTGEILRDLWLAKGGGSGMPIIDDREGGSGDSASGGSGGGGDDDRDDDGDDDDRDDDDGDDDDD
ncbi:MAG: hypothetical protein ACK4TJ_02955 [Tabrizicola sp.]